MWDRFYIESSMRRRRMDYADMPNQIGIFAGSVAVVALLIGILFTVIQANEMRDIQHVNGVVAARNLLGYEPTHVIIEFELEGVDPCRAALCKLANGADGGNGG